MMNITRNMEITNHLFLTTTFFICLAIIVSSPIGLAENICLTRECNETAAEIVRNIDSNVLPCDNFYQFACGKLVKNIDRRRETQISSLIQSYLEQNLRHVMNEKNERFQKAFTLYRLCKDQNANAGGLNFLRQIIDKIGGWPVLEGENWVEKNWENVTGELSKLNYNSGIFFYPKMVVFMPGLNVIMMKPMPFKLSNESADDLTQVAIKLGAHPSVISKQSFINISTHFSRLNELPTITYGEDTFTIRHMKLRWPSIDWMTFFTGYFSNVSSLTMTENQFVRCNEKHVDEIVKVIEQTPKSVIINYVIADIVEKLLPQLQPEIVKTSDVKSRENTVQVWDKFCADVTTQEFPRMAHALLYVNYFEGRILNEFHSISEALKNKMGELIVKANWLHNETIEFYMQKLSSLTYGISNFNIMTIDEYIDDYNDLILDESNFYHAIWSIVTFRQNYLYPKLLNVTDPAQSRQRSRRTIEEHIDELNGAYYPGANRVDVSMGAILYPFFKSNCPSYSNYAGLGFLIGHEIAHGSSVNEVYNYIAQVNDPESYVRNEFFDKIDCFVAQYNKTNAITQIPADLETAISENIADYIGIKLVHSIYEDWTKKKPTEPKLHGLDYTPMQIFWISLAQNVCTYVVNITNNLNDRFHSSELYQLNDALIHNPKFSEAFKCSSESYMNPPKKCTLW